MANTEREIFVAIRDILKADATLAYVSDDSILDGFREDIPEEAFPAIMLEPESTSEETVTTNRGHMMRVRVTITCAMKHADYDKQIVGDGSVKGIYDFVDDVKNALDAYPRLELVSPRVDRFTFPATRYFFEFFPFRLAEITFEGFVKTAGPNR